MFATILLDLDGTLIDSAPDIAESTNHVRALRGLPPLPVEEVVAAIGGGVRELLARTVPGDGEEALALYREHHEAHCLDRTVLYPGTREALEHLAGGAALAVVTNKPGALASRILEGLGVRHLLRVVVGGDGPFGRKPDPGPLQAALEALRHPSWSALMVGDAPSDIRAGQAAGCGTCAVAWGYRPLDEALALGPDFTAAGWQELLARGGLAGEGPRTVFAHLGEAPFQRVARSFYARVARDPRLAPMFPEDLAESAQRLAAFLVQFFGGPPEYTRRRGPPRLRMRHAPFPIGRGERDAWMENMHAALGEAAVPPPALGILRRYLEDTATFLINRER